MGIPSVSTRPGHAKCLRPLSCQTHKLFIKPSAEGLHTMNIGFSSHHAAIPSREWLCAGRHHMLKVAAPRFHLNSLRPSLFQPPQNCEQLTRSVRCGIFFFFALQHQRGETKKNQKERRRAAVCFCLFFSVIFKNKYTLGGAEEARNPPTGPTHLHGMFNGLFLMSSLLVLMGQCFIGRKKGSSSAVEQPGRVT